MSEGTFSPTLERLLDSRLGRTVTVSSAGTHALVGHPFSEPMAAPVVIVAAAPMDSRLATFPRRCCGRQT
jgi:hypothetical protein